MLFQIPIFSYLILCPLFLVIFAAFRAISSPLRGVPGPLLARFSRMWYVWQINLGKFHLKNIELHRQKGPVVQLGPYLYSISDEEALKTIYSHQSNFEKSSWYDAWNLTADRDKPNLFSDRNAKRHGATRRKVSGMYSTTGLVTYEGFVDDCIVLFTMKLDQFAASKSEISLADWLQYYAFDVIGKITFGKRFGFLDQGVDVGGIINTLDQAFMLSTNLGVFSEFFTPVAKFGDFLGVSANNKIVQFGRQNIEEKRKEMDDLDHGPTPMVDKLLRMQKSAGTTVPEWEIDMHLLTNIGAGSDTTAISLSAVLYYVYTNPSTLRKLRDEIDATGIGGIPAFKVAQSMPYFQAVMKEALRLHPATGLPLFRRVPKGGAVIAGRHFPENTNVGINSWVAHYNTSVFGTDADTFRPERWLEADIETSRRMEKSYMPFGCGSRTCIGKNISLLEMNKLIPVIVRDFDLELCGKSAENLEAFCMWFVQPTNLRTRVNRRDQPSNDQSSIALEHEGTDFL